MIINLNKYGALVSDLYMHYGNDVSLDTLIDEIAFEIDTLKIQVKPLLENKNTCPKCNSELIPSYYIGYYDSFPYWNCKCIGTDEFFTKNINKGSYG